jgi:hypothetical protein
MLSRDRFNSSATLSTRTAGNGPSLGCQWFSSKSVQNLDPLSQPRYTLAKESRCPRTRRKRNQRLQKPSRTSKWWTHRPKFVFRLSKGPMCFGTDFEAVHRRRRRKPRRKKQTWSLYPMILAPLPSHWLKSGCRRNYLKLSNGVCTLEKVGVRCSVADVSLPYTASRYRQVKRGVKEVVKGIRKGEKG